MRRWKSSSHRMLQPLGDEARRTSEEQSHQRDDQAVVRASDGYRDRAKSNTSDVRRLCRRSARRNSSAAVSEIQLGHREHDDSK